MSKTLRYLLFTFISAYILQLIACHDIALENAGARMEVDNLIALCMFMPTIGALVAGADLRQFGWKPDVSRHIKLILLAWLLPTVTQLLGAALYYGVFPEDFDLTGIYLREYDPEAFMELESSGKPYVSYVIHEIFVSFASPHILIAMLLGLGEEIGWRGFLFPRLKTRFGRTKGLLLGGALHGAWHFPVMLLIGYEYGKEYIGAPLLGLFAFCLYTIGMGIVADFLYEKSDCIWLPALFHGAINSSFSPHIMDTCVHDERSIFGPVDIGLISMIPLLFLALNILYYENKREKSGLSQP